MTIVLRILLLLGLAMTGAAQAAHAQLPGLGVKYRNTITVGRHIFPLLDGEWTVVATEATRSSQGRAGIERVFLAQMAGDRLARWIYISANSDFNSGNWARNKSVCDRKDVHVSWSDSNNNDADIQCWELNHVGMTLGKSASQADIDFYRWSDSRGRPNTALSLSYFFAKKGDFFRADYSFNPVVAGFKDTASAGWRGNPWHMDIDSKDEKKLAYLRTLKATGEELFGKLKAVLN